MHRTVLPAVGRTLQSDNDRNLQAQSNPNCQSDPDCPRSPGRRAKDKANKARAKARHHLRRVVLLTQKDEQK
jgi:hypothetical protein